MGTGLPTSNTVSELKLLSMFKYFLQEEEPSTFSKRNVYNNKKIFEVVEKLIRISDCSYSNLLEKNNNLVQENLLLKLKNKELYNLCNYDDLTKVYSRRYLMSVLDKEIHNSLKTKYSFAISMLDLDEFKNVNDTYSHIAGDFILKRIASIIHESIRESDIVGRYGGEEFLIILPNTNIFNAVEIIERVRTNIEESIHIFNDDTIKVTSSFGITNNGMGYVKNKRDILLQADYALREAKKMGRNKAVIYPELICNTSNKKQA